MSHGKDAIPSGGRLIEKVFLAALPVHARGAIFWPAVEDELKCVLRFGPLAFAVEIAPGGEEFQAYADIFW